MTSKAKTLLAQVGSFLLAAGLLYLALLGVDFERVGTALRTADYRWLPLLVVIVLVSHLLRAWRWTLLLDTLPGRSRRRVSLKGAFYSVMIGYMVNYAVPRLGEVARAANLTAHEDISFSGVFGTVVVERVLDLVTLMLALVSALLLFLDRFAALNEMLAAPARAQLGQLPASLLAGIVVFGLLLTLLGWWLLTRPGSRIRQFWQQRITPLLASFKDGVMTLSRCPRRMALVVSTVAMWACYLLMAHIPLVMLGIAETYHLTLVKTWAIFLMGSLGIVVPSPGGTGSYHYITIETLQRLFDVARSPAATYAVLTHAAQLVLYTLIGFACLLLQGTSLRTLRRRTIKAEDELSEESSDDGEVASSHSQTHP